MASLEKSLAKGLECAICHEELHQPKIAGRCGHTFCQDCLQRYIATTAFVAYRPGFKCPFCRGDCATPEMGVQDLATNFTVAGIIESLNKSRLLKEQVISKPCELCQGGPAAAAAAEQACAACDGIILCKTCGRQHQKHHETKHHVVTGICEPHGKPLRFYCRTCDVVLCILCRASNFLPEDHHRHDVVLYRDEVSTGRNELRTALRIARKETKGELERVEGRLVNLLAEETRTLNLSRDEIQNSVEEAVNKNKAKMEKREAKIKMLRQEVARLEEENKTTSEQTTRFLDLGDKFAQKLEDTRGKAEDDVNVSKGEIMSLMYPLNKQIKHGQLLMAQQALMPELRNDLTDTRQELQKLSSSAQADRLTHVQERIALRKPDFHEVAELLKHFSNCVDVDRVDDDSSGESVQSRAEIGLEYYVTTGKDASGCYYEDVKIPSSVKRVQGISIMWGNRWAVCGSLPIGSAWSLWLWNATELKVLKTDNVSMIDLATVGKDELVILRGENPHLRLLNVVTEEVHDIRIKKYNQDGLLSFWQVEVITAEKFIVTFRTKDGVHHVAIVNKEGGITQDIKVEQRQCIAFCRMKSIIITCSFLGTTLTVYNYDSEKGANVIRSTTFSELDAGVSEGFQCTDICSGRLGEVYIVGRIEQQLFQPSWKQTVKEIQVYQLYMYREDELEMYPDGFDAMAIPRRMTLLAIPGLKMRSKWVPKCSMGGSPANNLLVEYGNEAKIITLKASSKPEHNDLCSANAEDFF
ncbi:uncharacterized protein LOC135490602 [Lineus longissimus]|uniref:uncharacterized protein LOC135490602 n=1 Tax=Lineus longissimus TaxID=88925 RepID=UPI00315CF0A4